MSVWVGKKRAKSTKKKEQDEVKISPRSSLAWIPVDRYSLTPADRYSLLVGQPDSAINFYDSPFS
jgi:hypothetical protein